MKENTALVSVISGRSTNTMYIVIYLTFSTRCFDTFPMWCFYIPKKFCINQNSSHRCSISFLFDSLVHSILLVRRLSLALAWFFPEIIIFAMIWSSYTPDMNTCHTFLSRYFNSFPTRCIGRPLFFQTMDICDRDTFFIFMLFSNSLIHSILLILEY